MKIKKYTIIIASMFTMPFANAALYTLNNGSGSTAAGIQTKTGEVFRSGTIAGATLGTGAQNIQTSAGPGIVAFGFFSTDDFSTTSTAASLVALFTQFGASAEFGAASTGGNRSVFSRAATATIGTTFNTRNIYLFSGNGSTFANSTQFLVAKMDSTAFAVADDVANATVAKVITINPSNSTVLLGSEISNVYTTNTDASPTPGWQMAALVPEPSSALLGAIGALILLRRRRI